MLESLISKVAVPPGRDGADAEKAWQESRSPRLRKSWGNRWIGGVCGGIAERYGLAPAIPRVILLLALVVAALAQWRGAALAIGIVYLGAYFVLPWNTAAPPRERVPGKELWSTLGLFLGVWGAAMAIFAWGPAHSLRRDYSPGAGGIAFYAGSAALTGMLSAGWLVCPTRGARKRYLVASLVVGLVTLLLLVLSQSYTY